MVREQWHENELIFAIAFVDKNPSEVWLILGKKFENNSEKEHLQSLLSQFIKDFLRW